MEAVYSKIMDNFSGKLVGCESQTELIQANLKAFMERQESGSMLLIGTRGSGKKTVLNRVLSNCERNSQLVTVKVNGFVHTTDKLAVKHFAKQINEQISDKVAELEIDDCNEEEDIPSTSVPDYFRRILAKSKKATSRSYLFVVEEFDQFALRPSQILLYLLLDASRSNELAPVFVLGITPRHDVIELLEKRVRSRLDNRLVHFDQNLDFAKYLQVARDLLLCDQVKKEPEKEWNKCVQDLFDEEDVIDRLTEIHYRDNSVATLKHLLRGLVAIADDCDPYLDSETFLKAANLSMPAEDPYAVVIKGLSVLELCLLVCIWKRQKQNADGSFNFQTILDDFYRFARAHYASFSRYPREVLLKSLERLSALALIGSDEGGVGKSQQLLFKPMVLQVDGDLVQSVAKQCQPMPNTIAYWINHDRVY